ncbi:MAG: hypothetical protein OEV88_06915 [Gammaproteobacteria bacterium]|nr:hypothetical protein [Gammaproteobacteria bacterium]
MTLTSGIDQLLKYLFAVAVTLLLITSSNLNAGENTAMKEIEGWNELVDALRDLPGQLLARLPPEMRNDPQVQQEVARLALESLASSAIGSLGGSGDHPAFLPTIGQVLNVGQPNADTVYRLAQITPGGVYRITGKKGSLRMVAISQSVAAKDKKPSPRVYDHDLNAVPTDASGRYEVLLSMERPAGYKGEWWQLQPATSGLLLRMVSSDWDNEVDPTISIERLDTPVQYPRPTADELEQRLRVLPSKTAFIAGLFVDHVQKLRQEGYVNRLKTLDVSQIGGLAGQFYYEGVYELNDDEALVIETRVPARCLYRSIILTNQIYETTDWYNNHSSLNDAQALPDSDGILRVVVSARDPGIPNWLDTAGYPMGVVQGRWTGCTEKPIPGIRKVAVDSVPDLLPADTPSVSLSQRQEIIRARRRALQQRPQW